MFRLGPLAVILIPLFLAACGQGDQRNVASPLEQTVVACEAQPNPEVCVDAVNTALSASRPTEPPPPPAVRDVLFRNDVVHRLIGAGAERVDFWLIIDTIPPGSPHGDVGAMAIIVFKEPVSYSGTVPDRSGPCDGHGVEGHVDPDDPCLDQPREYGTREISFIDVRVVHTQVDTGRGGVVWFSPDDADDSIVKDMIRWAEETQYGTPPSPIAP